MNYIIEISQHFKLLYELDLQRTFITRQRLSWRAQEGSAVFRETWARWSLGN